MPNPSGPDHDETSDQPVADRDVKPAEPAGPATHEPRAEDQSRDDYPTISTDADPATEVITSVSQPEPKAAPQQPPERRFTAPGFDAGATEIMQLGPQAPTEAFSSQSSASKKATPQLIPPRLASKLPVSVSRSWGWVLALILIILALAAIAVLGTLWLTRDSRARASQEERVRDSIYQFDIAVQNGDLPTLRGLTCGTVRDDYLNYNEQAWDDTYRRIAAAKQYPVVASVDEVVVNGDHAEANVTAFMAYAPQIRSTRSLDLQYRDDQWKICQSSTE